MTRYLIWVLIIFGCFSPLEMEAQTDIPFFKLFSSGSGLKAEAINAIVQDSSGLLWIGTDNGLYRYDGHVFKQMNHNERHPVSLLSNNIQHLFLDSFQNLWIGYYQSGLSVWNLKSQSRYNFPDFVGQKQLKSNRVMGCQYGDFGEIWVFFHDVSWLTIDPVSYSFRVITPEFKESKTILFRNATYVTAYKKWFLSSLDGFFEYNVKTNQTKLKRFLHNGQPVNRIHNATYGSYFLNDFLWISTWGGGILQYDIANDTILASHCYNNQVLFSGATNHSFNELVLNDSCLLIATPDSGVGVFNTSSKTYTFMPYVFEETQVEPFAFSLFMDKYNGVWIGAKKNLIYYKWQHFSQQLIPLVGSNNLHLQRLNFPSVITSFGPYYICASYHGRGLYMVDKQNLQFVRELTAPPKTFGHEDDFSAFSCDSLDRDILLVNTAKGLFSVSISTNSWNKYVFEGAPELNSKRFSVVKCKKNHILLGLGASRVGVYNIQTQKFIKSPKVENLFSQNVVLDARVFDIALYDDSCVYFGTEWGLACFMLKQNELHVLSGVLDANHSRIRRVTNISMDSKNSIWFSTAESGVVNMRHEWWKDTVYNQYTRAEGLPGDQVKAFEVDSEDNIWGLYGSDLFCILANRQVLTWNHENGLAFKPGDWGNIKVIDEHVFYGKLNAWVRLKREMAANIEPPKPIIIVELFYNGAFQIVHNQKVELSYQNAFIDLSFAMDDIANGSHTMYRYRLNPNGEWIGMEKSNRILLSNLAPGNYVLELSYKNNVQAWTSPQKIIDIAVSPPFYQTVWFLFLILVGLSAVYYVIHRLVLSKKSLQIKYENQLQQLQLDALRSQMNPHFIFNCINSIQYYILQNDKVNAGHFLAKFAHLIRSILNNSRKEFSTLADEISFLRDYVALEQMRLQQSFDFEVEIDPIVDIALVDLPVMLLQPYVENAIWHGLMHKDSRGLLHLYVSRNHNQHVVIIITDNGIGREKAKSLQVNKPLKQGSYGTLINHERTKLHNSLHTKYHLEVTIEDAQIQEPVGTRVKIEIHDE